MNLNPILISIKLLSKCTAFSIIASLCLMLNTASAKGRPVGITSTLTSVSVMHDGKKVEIMRNQDNTANIDPGYAKTSRPCPPFCIQPINLGKGIETIGELEVINYAKKMSDGDKTILLVDSRTPDWVSRGTIPSAINISWVELTPRKGATTEGIMKIMLEKFGVKLKPDMDEVDVDEAIANGDTSTVFDFSNAKTLVMFCNGMWCGQSPASISALRKFGYPAEKLKYYRGGMQDWYILGLTTVKSPH